jgi:hypothetical protein
MRKYIQRRQGPELEENGLSIATHSGVEGGGGDDFTCGCREKKEEKREKRGERKTHPDLNFSSIVLIGLARATYHAPTKSV